MLYFIEFLIVFLTLGYFIFIEIKKYKKRTDLSIAILLKGIFWKLGFIILSFIFFIKQESFIYSLIFEVIPDIYESILNIFR